MLHFQILAIMALLAILAISGYPPFLSTETLSEPYLGLISGGATPTPLHPRYTLNTPWMHLFIAFAKFSFVVVGFAENQMSRPADRDKKGGRDAISTCKYAACHDVTTDLQILE